MFFYAKLELVSSRSTLLHLAQLLSDKLAETNELPHRDISRYDY
jgi:hypothetical protein